MFRGKIQSYKNAEKLFASAMQGKEVSKLEITKTEIVGNAIADKQHHGGIDKCVFVYDCSSYVHWEKVLGLKIAYGGMGENLLLQGVKTQGLCVGDWLIFGNSVILEVSMPRVQCFKIPSIYPVQEDKNALAKFIFEKGEVGFYLRVIKEGILTKDLSIVHKRKGKLSLEALHKIYKNPNNYLNEVQQVLDDEVLGESFKRNLRDRLECKCATLLDWQLA